MQDKNAPNLHFLHRTDALAGSLGCTVKELSEHTGLSWRTIIAARKSGNRITSKTWAALERAEREAGITVREQPHPLLPGVALSEQPSEYNLKAVWQEHCERNPTKYYEMLRRYLRELAELRHPDSVEKGSHAFEEMSAILHLAMDEAVYRAALQHLQGHGSLNRLTGMEEEDPRTWPKGEDRTA